MKKTQHQHVVLTGVTRGCGHALAIDFIRQGLRVSGCGRSTDKIASLRSQFGAPHSFEVVDVASDEQVAAWAQRVLAMGEPPDLLINNAAIINPSAHLWLVSAQDFSDVIDVNIKGVANVIRHFVPAMVERKKGVVVNISSGWGRSTDAEVAPYCATKWAVEGLTQALSQELPHGMAAVALNPGIINTEMLRSCFGASASGYPGPEDWARRASPYILSLGASQNGKSLSVE